MATPSRLRPFLLFALSLLVAAFVLEVVNGRFWLNDFRVYHMAAEALREGTPIYGVAFGEDTGLYKYAPAVLYFFLPTSFLPFTAAAVLHYAYMVSAVLYLFVLGERIITRHLAGQALPRASLRATLGLLCIVVLLARELHLGNINLGLVVLVLACTEDLLDARPFRAGLFLGVACVVKPYLLLLTVPLLLRREWRLFQGMAVAVVVAFALPLLYPGPVQWWPVHRAWIDSMLGHSHILDSPDTLRSLGSHLVGRPLPQWAGITFILLAGAMLAGWTWRHQHTRRPDPDRDRALELWTAFAVVPNLVVTDQEHFLYALPLILYVLAYLFRQRDRQVLVLFLVAMLLHGTRSSDLWGSAWEDRFVGWGVLGSGNILLIGTALLCHHRWRPGPDTAPEALSDAAGTSVA